MTRHEWSGPLRRLVRAVWEGLQAAGAIWIPVPEVTPQPHTPPDVPRHPGGSDEPGREPLTGPGTPTGPSALPGRGHPERIASHIPPNAQERALWRQLEERS
ncbi:DUF6059 family protein [Streptomyces acidicola]|uniref:DUF6059 family protein n=1 Tax=Streptomyces acidicola TaxID=2596892 RepID=UPI00380818E8